MAPPPSWRKYCFFSAGNIIYDIISLNEIKDFIQGLMGERKEDKRKSEKVVDRLMNDTKARIQRLVDEKRKEKKSDA